MIHHQRRDRRSGPQTSGAVRGGRPVPTAACTDIVADTRREAPHPIGPSRPSPAHDAHRHPTVRTRHRDNARVGTEPTLPGPVRVSPPHARLPTPTRSTTATSTSDRRSGARHPTDQLVSVTPNPGPPRTSDSQRTDAHTTLSRTRPAHAAPAWPTPSGVAIVPGAGTTHALSSSPASRKRSPRHSSGSADAPTRVPISDAM